MIYYYIVESYCFGEYEFESLIVSKVELTDHEVLQEHFRKNRPIGGESIEDAADDAMKDEWEVTLVNDPIIVES